MSRPNSFAQLDDQVLTRHMLLVIDDKHHSSRTESCEKMSFVACLSGKLGSVANGTLVLQFGSFHLWVKDVVMEISSGEVSLQVNRSRE